MGVCVRARMCETLARMVLTRVHVKIHSAVRYLPFVVKITFHVPNFCIIIILKYVFRNTTINVTKLPLCNRSSLIRCWCYGALLTGTVGCFALYPRNLFLIQLQHIRLKQNIKLGDILIPQKAPSNMVTRNLFEV